MRRRRRRSAYAPNIMSICLVLVAVAAVTLMLIPVHFWQHPVTDAVYRGFDRNLVFVDNRGSGSVAGSVEISPQYMQLVAQPGSEPTVDLVTSPLGFSVSMDAQVTTAGLGQDRLIIGIWGPSTGSGYYLNFGAGPTNAITVNRVIGGQPSTTLIGGHVVDTIQLGKFVPGATYHLVIELNKRLRLITVQITSTTDTGVATKTSVDASEFSELFKSFRPTLAISVSAHDSRTVATISNYILTLPSQPDSSAELVEKISDPRAWTLTLITALLGAILIAIAIGRFASRRVNAVFAFSLGRPSEFDAGERASPRVGKRLAVMLLSVGVIGAFFVANVYLFHFGTPHFDVYTPKIWSYIAANYSVLELYHWPFLIPAAGVQGGIPWHDAAFPYGPTKVYYYQTIGWVYRLAFAPTTSGLSVNSPELEFLVKAFNVVFGIVDAALVYSISQRISQRTSSSVLVAALFLLNPAVIFLMSVWGSTETVSLLFMLLSIWLAQRNSTGAAWTALALGAFTRPQMLVLAFLIGLVYLRTFRPSDNVTGISTAAVAFFVIFAPLSLAISPSIPVDYVTHILNFSVGTGQADQAYLAISPGYYSVWTLPLLYVNGLHGLDRMWHTRTDNLIGTLSYGQASTYVVLAFLLFVAILILSQRRTRSIGAQLPLVTFGLFGWLFLMDGLISRYFLYGLVFVILCHGSMTRGIYALSVSWLTAVTLITSWSHFGIDVLGNLATTQPLNPQHNPITQALLTLFANDRFITEASAMNLLILVLAGITAVGSIRHKSQPTHEVTEANSAQVVSSRSTSVADGVP